MVALMVSVIDILTYMTYVCMYVYAEKLNAYFALFFTDATPDELYIE